MPNLFSWFFSSRFFARARRGRESSSAIASSASSRTETKASGAPARGAPSFFLLASSFLLLVAGAVGLLGGEAREEGRRAELVARGWVPWDGSPQCPAASPAGSFYELESDDDSLEAYGLGRLFLVARPPTSGAAYRCRPIPEPHFVQEIL